MGKHRSPFIGLVRPGNKTIHDMPTFQFCRAESCRLKNPAAAAEKWIVMTLAICPGSFDPVTLGHYDVIKRASALFDKVIVVVMVNSTKRPAFTVEERVDFIRRTVDSLPNVEVDTYTGLLA
ncbi:MAG TPA: adenylyltransferase/cytidyltransferase family protein, partial [Clostridia bacterium]|nr:adenylyltransferase/cytidyltransferase family protein [Clostridia bacterium]